MKHGEGWWMVVLFWGIFRIMSCRHWFGGSSMHELFPCRCLPDLIQELRNLPGKVWCLAFGPRFPCTQRAREDLQMEPGLTMSCLTADRDGELLTLLKYCPSWSAMLDKPFTPTLSRSRAWCLSVAWRKFLAPRIKAEGAASSMRKPWQVNQSLWWQVLAFQGPCPWFMIRRSWREWHSKIKAASNLFCTFAAVYARFKIDWSICTNCPQELAK